MDHVMVAGLLEIRHDDVARIVLGLRAALAHQAGGPQAQQLVLARPGLELQLEIVLELVLKGLLALVERRHFSRSIQPRLRRFITTGGRPFHPVLGMAKYSSGGKGERWRWKGCATGSARRKAPRI